MPVPIRVHVRSNGLVLNRIVIVALGAFQKTYSPRSRNLLTQQQEAAQNEARGQRKGKGKRKSNTSLPSFHPIKPFPGVCVCADIRTYILQCNEEMEMRWEKNRAYTEYIRQKDDNKVDISGTVKRTGSGVSFS